MVLASAGAESEVLRRVRVRLIEDWERPAYDELIATEH